MLFTPQAICCPHCSNPMRITVPLSYRSSPAALELWTDGQSLGLESHRLSVTRSCPHCKRCFWPGQAHVIDQAPGEEEHWEQYNADGRMDLTKRAPLGPDDQWAKAPLMAAIFDYGKEQRARLQTWTASLPRAGEPSEEDYYRAFHEGHFNTLEEGKWLRIHAWWAYNRTCRSGGDYPWKVAYLTTILPGPHTQTTLSKIRPQAPPTHPPRLEKNLQALKRLLRPTSNLETLMKAEVLRQLGEFDEALRILTFITDDFSKSTWLIYMKTLCQMGDRLHCRFPLPGMCTDEDNFRKWDRIDRTDPEGVIPPGL